MMIDDYTHVNIFYDKIQPRLGCPFFASYFFRFEAKRSETETISLLFRVVFRNELIIFSLPASPIPFVATLLYCATSSSVLVSVVATTFVSLFRFANFRFRFASFRFELK